MRRAFKQIGLRTALLGFANNNLTMVMYSSAKSTRSTSADWGTSSQTKSVPGPWADGCADDVLLFTELVNGAGAMPDDLLRLVPKAMKDSSAGLMVLYHLNPRVCAISEAATAVQEEEFRA